MIFTNHRDKLKVPEKLYKDREARLAKFIELKAPPVIVKHAAQRLISSFSWSWRGLLGDVWLWAQYNPAGWWARWVFDAKFRAETNVAGLEMMAALSSGDGLSNEDLDDGVTEVNLVVPISQRRRFLESWPKWKRRAQRGGAQ